MGDVHGEDVEENTRSHTSLDYGTGWMEALWRLEPLYLHHLGSVGEIEGDPPEGILIEPNHFHPGLQVWSIKSN